MNDEKRKKILRPLLILTCGLVGILIYSFFYFLSFGSAPNGVPVPLAIVNLIMCIVVYVVVSRSLISLVSLNEDLYHPNWKPSRLEQLENRLKQLEKELAQLEEKQKDKE